MTDRRQPDPGPTPATAAEASPGVLDRLLARSVQTGGLPGVVVGQLSGRDGSGVPLVNFPGNPAPAPVPALSTVAIDQVAAGHPVVLVFDNQDPGRPIVIGVIQAPSPTATTTADDREVILEGKDRLELRCGKAKLVLRSDGKVLVKGTDVLSRSEGPNRIKGASVQIN